MNKILPIRLLIISIFILLNPVAYGESTSFPKTAYENSCRPDGKKFPITISLDNQIGPLFHSQDIGTNIALSTMNSLAFISYKYSWHTGIIGTITNTILSFYIALLNHEFTGHGLKGQEFGAKLEAVGIGLFHGWASVDHTKLSSVQENDIISINGNQSNTLLAEKLPIN